MIPGTLLPLLLALAGCGGGTEPSAAPSPGPNDPVGTVAPSTVPDPSPLATEVSVDPSLVEPRPHAWEDAEVTGERTLRLTWYGGAVECYGLADVDVRYRRREIVVTLREGRIPVAEVCPEYAMLKATIVELDEPIGERRITDGALRSAP